MSKYLKYILKFFLISLVALLSACASNFSREPTVTPVVKYEESNVRDSIITASDFYSENCEIGNDYFNSTIERSSYRGNTTFNYIYLNPNQETDCLPVLGSSIGVHSNSFSASSYIKNTIKSFDVATEILLTSIKEEAGDLIDEYSDLEIKHEIEEFPYGNESFRVKLFANEFHFVTGVVARISNKTLVITVIGLAAQQRWWEDKIKEKVLSLGKFDPEKYNYTY